MMEQRGVTQPGEKQSVQKRSCVLQIKISKVKKGMKSQKRCYLGVLLWKMKEMALKCAGKQKEEFPVFIMWFKPRGDCEQS